MAEKLAAFVAAFSELKQVKTRGVYQFVFEVPVDKANEALDALGGVPNSATEVWCAIAKLKEGMVAPSVLPAPEARPLNPLVQQLGIVCREKAFWKFLESKGIAKVPVQSSEHAAQIVRDYLDVISRAEIEPDDPKAGALLADYRAWMREPRAVG